MIESTKIVLKKIKNREKRGGKYGKGGENFVTFIFNIKKSIKRFD